MREHHSVDMPHSQKLTRETGLVRDTKYHMDLAKSGWALSSPLKNSQEGSWEERL